MSTESQRIESERLAYLREMYAVGSLSLADFEEYVEVVLRGQQPNDKYGFPFMPDPCLHKMMMA